MVNKDQYHQRLDSPYWKSLTKEFRYIAKNQCQMCGDKEPEGGLHTHHMTYEHVGRKEEWNDVVVICDRCHSNYHEIHRLPPRGAFTRIERLNHLAETLKKREIDVSFFEKEGETQSRIWCNNVFVAVEDVHKKIRVAKLIKEKRLEIHAPITSTPKSRKQQAKIDKKKNWELNLQLDVLRFPDVAGMLIQGRNVKHKVLAQAFGINLSKCPRNWLQLINKYVKRNERKIKKELLEMGKKPCPVLSREK